MLHTAKFVHTHGGQTEIILRVKQGSNPTFSFLMPEDPLHPFFRFMVEDYERLAQAMQSKPQGERLESKERDAVSLVAAAYGEDDEDESEGEDGAEPSGAGGQGARPSAEGGRETQPSGGGEKAVQDSAEGDEQQRQRKNGTGDSDGAAEGMDLPVGGQEAERLEERSVGIEDGGASAGEGVKEGSSEREAAVQSKPSGGVEETNPPLSEAPDNSDVQVEASDDPAEQVSPEVGEKAKAGPSLVNFAIAKNPPLAAVRKAKRETSAGGSEKDPDAGSVADRKRSELLEDSVVDQPLESEGKFTLASGENLFHAAGVNEPLAISLNGVSPSRVNEPLSVGVNKPLPVGVNEPPLQTKRVIEKMVEFIARNGKHFEAVVRKKDEQERRFPFLAPWDPYHGYYASLLEELLKKKVRSSVDSIRFRVPLLYYILTSDGLHGQNVEEVQNQFMNLARLLFPDAYPRLPAA